MSQSPAGPSEPTNTSESERSEASGTPASAAPTRERSPLALAALAAVAVPGLDPARLALPQEQSAALRVVGVVDTQGRHWEVLETHDDATGATLDAEAEVLRRIGRVVDDGRLSFNVPRPAGTLRPEGSHIQVRSHLEGRPIDLASLRPGPGLSAGLGKALGEFHDLPTSVISEAGLPVYDADDVRSRWLNLLDDAAGTGKVPLALLARWEVALEDSALWRFRPVVVHGDLAPENVLTAGGAVVAVRGLGQAHVGDPAEDMAWVYASVPVDCLDSVESAYDLARAEGVDRHLRDRAELASELSLARWLMHGVRSRSDSIIDDAVAMLADLADQVGDEPLVEPRGPRLAPVPGEKETAEPEATTSEVKMVLVDDDTEDSANTQNAGTRGGAEATADGAGSGADH
ncbi:phosphotransferase [Actinomyces sp.]|uniref:phosphotransferase n=1 Tax=Actinomyces sp. TaxID=29317 RepID=UPI0026DD67CC|nr:phosphotransferase [Actinomyces sp.]MDO4899299.1 phosphotransferase [Actinomyces sp.]